MAREEAEALRARAAPIAERAGLDLVDVSVKGGGKQRLVRVIVDRRGGVDLQSCQRVSEELSRELDRADDDPFASSYHLEVTSPGTDRALVDPEAFARVIGREVLVQRAREGEPTEQLTGVVRAAHDDAVELEVEGSTVHVPYGELVKATQTLPW